MYPSEPRPSPDGVLRAKASWRCTGVEGECWVEPDFATGFADILSHRRTFRNLVPLARERTLGLVRHAFHALAMRRDGESFRQQKSVVSAGALHPIDLIIAGGPQIESPLLYDDLSDKFLLLEVRSEERLKETLARLSEISPEALGHIVVYAAHPMRVSSVYENAMSLVWRDAGAADQLLSMAAFAAGMTYLPLGALANDVIISIRGEDEEVIGVGCGIIGERVS